jgi:hypothetical protein
MSDSELSGLGEDIKKRGLQTPIAILVGEDGTEWLLDGISRLDAMELVGLPVVTNCDLNQEVAQTQTVAGNVDPFAYVLSANIHRRHLTREQKAELIDRRLKVKPEQSNRTIAKQVKSDDKTVGKRRKKLESTAEIPQLAKRTGADGKERKQPAKKQKPTISADTAATEPATIDLAKTPEVEASFEILDCHSSRLLSFLEQFTTILEFCENDSNWPPLNAGRQKRRAKAVRKMRDALVGTDRPCQAGTWPWSPAQDCGGVSVDP